MNTRRCEHCREHLGARHAHNARFCSGRCRTAAHRAARTLPRELTCRARWVRHTVRKVPLTVEGRAASSTDPGTWSSYRAAARSSAGVGLGFVLDGDGIVCVDLDHVVRPDGSLVGWAAELLAGLPPTYVEVSPSGTGLHVFGLGRLPGRGRRWVREEGTGLEVYADGRFVTVTGDRWADSPARLSDLSKLIAELGC